MTDVTSFDGTRLALRTWGAPDDPLILLVHGLGLSWESWGQVPERLADDHRVVAYDLRGHAQSGDARSGGYTMEAHARDLAEVLAAVASPERPAVVVTHSLGGGILLAHVSATPGRGDDRMCGAVFAGSGGSGVTVPGFPARGVPPWARARLRSGWFALLRATARFGRRIRPVDWISDRLVRSAAFAPDEPIELVRRVRESFLTTRPLALAGTTLASVTHDGVDLAGSLRVPTLLVHGTRDPEVPGAEAENLLSALPDGELVSVPGAGHMLALTHPDVVVAQVRRWAQRCVAHSTGQPLAPAGQSSTVTSTTG
jgi:pimeloyl-ACP methyl ester carboxylesterase